jgi:predicted nucleotidyltransferase
MKLAKSIPVSQSENVNNHKLAWGNIRTESDIDLAVIALDFGQNGFEEGKLLMRIARMIAPRIKSIPISSVSYKKVTWTMLIYEIRKKELKQTKLSN